MSHIVRLRDEAERDLADAASWYEQQQLRLGHQFLDDAQSVFDRLATEPLAFPIMYRSARRALMNRFPFGIYFFVEQSNVIVFAIIHGSRHPHRWKSRA